ASDELPVLREAVAGGDLDGLLMRADTGAVQLFLGGRAGWRSDLEAALGAARQQARLAESGIAPEQLAHVFEPVELDVVYHEDGSGPTRGGEVMLAIGVLVFAFIGLTTGLGYAFAGISGEKQQRITEQVVSAVPPQSWMDGKL